ncbi:MAG: helix-turn-helix domain-containing protein [Acidobacteriota bacterium]|nr:helix-turn-helix domain-containing protein [Acidobacteriota bacterium]
MMEHHAQRLLKLIPAEDDFISQLRQVLSEQLRCGNASLTIVSRKLAMSRRAVQRKLNSQGTSYRNVVDQMRSELSTNFLKQDSAEIEEIAMLLGFSDTCSFYRAFKRWTDRTPQEYLQS